MASGQPDFNKQAQVVGPIAGIPSGASGTIIAGQGVGVAAAFTDSPTIKQVTFSGDSSVESAAPLIIRQPSANLRNSDNDAKSTASLTPVKLKEIQVNAVLEGATIKFDAKIGVGGLNGKAQIYVNGVAIGTLQDIGGTSYATFSQDFAALNLVATNLIQVYAYASDVTSAVSIEKLQLFYDFKVTKINGKTLATQLVITDDPTVSTTNQDP